MKERFCVRYRYGAEEEWDYDADWYPYRSQAGEIARAYRIHHPEAEVQVVDDKDNIRAYVRTSSEGFAYIVGGSP